MLVLTDADVEKLMTMEEAIDASRTAYAELSRGAANVPLRHHVRMNAEAMGLVMSGFMASSQAYGVKVVSVVPGNKQRSLPTTLGAMLLLDPDTGQPLALLGATYLTALRTGAGTGVATDILANQDATVLAIIGTGGQAKAHVEAVMAVRRIDRILVYNRTRARALLFTEELSRVLAASPAHVTIEVVDSAQEAVAEAHIVVCSTNSHVPVVQAEWLREGAHVNATGAHAPDMQEIATDVVQRAAKVVVDTLEGAVVPGDLSVPIQGGLISKSEIVELGKIILGNASGRQDRSDITLFKSVGHASQDLVAAKHIVAKAVTEGLGATVKL